MNPKIDRLIQSLKSELSGCQKDDLDRLVKAYGDIIDERKDAILALKWLIADFDTIKKNNIKTYLSHIETLLTNK